MSKSVPTALLLAGMAPTLACGPAADLGSFAGFEDVTARWGLAEENAHGVCLADFDRDGRTDLFFAREGADRLWLQTAPGGYEVADLPFDPAAKSMGCGVADFDRDGWSDLVVTSEHSVTRLWRGSELEFLVDATEDVQLGHTFNQRSVLVEDIDGDGWVDLVLTSTQAEQAALFHNSAGESFEDRTSGSPLVKVRRSWGGGFLDYDNDRLPDLFLGKDILPERDQLLHNDGDLQLSEVSSQTGLTNTNHSMGVAVADVDGDGWLDFLVTNWGAQSLWRNLGGGEFLEGAQAWVS